MTPSENLARPDQQTVMGALFASQKYARLLADPLTVTTWPDNVTVPRLLGFAGWAESGKDAAAAALHDLYGHVITSTGQAVAALLCDINPLVETGPGEVERFAVVHERLGYEKAKALPGVRALMQDAGEQIKIRSPRYWIDLLVQQALERSAPTVITGIRSPDEVLAIREHAGVTLWVQRPGTSPKNGHANELRLTAADCDGVLDNSGSLRDLPEALTRSLLAL